MRVLAIGAHPDDIEIGCGGAIASMISKGATVDFLIMTSGEMGSDEVSPEDLKRIREKEAIEAGKVFGVKNIHFFNLQDGLTNYTRENKINLIALLRELKPEVVFTHSHQDRFLDHRIISELTSTAVQAAAGPWYQEAKGAPHRIEKSYGYEVWNPLNRWSHVFDITEFIEIKLLALQKHQSQMTKVDYCHAVKGLASYRGLLGAGSYCEVFDTLM